ncbi:MAG TPA: hypothetical protein VG456_16835 [Candidatus Sulfopaludibacter sp.]|jgi:hypothetical protein|nr:hypothetical protein [Candidatus Sulfopaludibacter sp.]
MFKLKIASAAFALLALSQLASAQGNGNGNGNNTAPAPVTQSVTQPVQINMSATASGGYTNIVMYTVPAGKRLVVEHFSSEAAIASTATIQRYALATTTNPQGSSNFVHFVSPGTVLVCSACYTGQSETIASQPIRMYVEPGQYLVANASYNGAVGPNAFIAFAISGYLINAN